MDFNQLGSWSHDAADLRREEDKRWYSPGSFFYSQGHALVLAARYFRKDRLISIAHGGVATKHLHRMHLALFGQLMASHEYLLKDFVAQVIQIVDIFDDRIKEAKWITIDSTHVLSARSVQTHVGAMLLHSTLGWHDPRDVNRRYKNLFRYQPIDPAEYEAMDRLWILRHSVAHNAGLVIAHDAVRIDLPRLSSQVVDINAAFIEEAFNFLCCIARRLAEQIGDRVLLEWLRSRVKMGKDWPRDKRLYTWMKLLATFVQSRAKALPKITKGQYIKDFNQASRPTNEAESIKDN